MAREAHRRALARREGQRLMFRGRIERFGTKEAYRGPDLRTILLKDVVFAHSGEHAAEHLWFTEGKWAQGANAGDVIEFDGWIQSYLKGYMGRRDDVYDSPIR